MKLNILNVKKISADIGKSFPSGELKQLILAYSLIHNHLNLC